MDDQVPTADAPSGQPSGPPRESPGGEPAPPEAPLAGTAPLRYEETPVIEPITPGHSFGPGQGVPMSPKSSSSRSLLGILGNSILFIVLFAVGVGISMVIRQYVTPSVPASNLVSPTATPGKKPTTSTSLATQTPTPLAALDPFSGWKSYEVLSGQTKQSVSGVSFKLPTDVLSPICDGASCASQGTYFLNGSRFTVAARGKGQLLADARGNVVVTDSSGKPFATKQITLVGGRKALEYSGFFSGTTVGGYTFSQMRGLMIEIDEGMTLEMNHFTPSGVSADFTKDDAIFDNVIQSLVVTRFPQISVTPTLIPILSPTKSATASPTP